MPRTLQTVAGHATTSLTVITPFTPNSGDSFNVANFAASAAAHLSDMWGDVIDTTYIRLRSPRMHDQAQGIRMRLPAASPAPVNMGVPQPLFPGDSLLFEVGTTAAAALAVGAFTIEYDDLPGGNPRLAAWADIQSRIVNIAGVEVDITAAAVAGDWSAGRAINADFDNLKANVDYAILGFTVPLETAVVAVAGPDTSNYKIGAPGTGRADKDSYAFVELAGRIGGPAIPIINANNKGATLCYAAPTSAAAVDVTFMLAELA